MATVNDMALTRGGTFGEEMGHVIRVTDMAPGSLVEFGDARPIGAYAVGSTSIGKHEPAGQGLVRHGEPDLGYSRCKPGLVLLVTDYSPGRSAFLGRDSSVKGGL